jgi:hypothetical protein
MPVYYRGNLIANGVPAADGHAFKGFKFMTEVEYAALVAGDGPDPAYIYNVVEGTAAGEIIVRQNHIADSAEATAPTTAQFNALLAALEAAGVLKTA